MRIPQGIQEEYLAVPWGREYNKHIRMAGLSSGNSGALFSLLQRAHTADFTRATVWVLFFHHN
jgi:hypothetical protein